jgi:hypothetical protein
MCLNSVLIRLTGPLDWRNARCTNFVGFPKEFSLCIPLVHRKVKGNKVWLKIYCAHNTIRCIGGERECDIVEVILRYFYRHCPRAVCYGLLLEGLRSLKSSHQWREHVGYGNLRGLVHRSVTTYYIALFKR